MPTYHPLSNYFLYTQQFKIFTNNVAFSFVGKLSLCFTPFEAERLVVCVRDSHKYTQNSRGRNVCQKLQVFTNKPDNNENKKNAKKIKEKRNLIVLYDE